MEMSNLALQAALPLIFTFENLWPGFSGTISAWLWYTIFLTGKQKLINHKKKTKINRNEITLSIGLLSNAIGDTVHLLPYYWLSFCFLSRLSVLTRNIYAGILSVRLSVRHTLIVSRNDRPGYVTVTVGDPLGLRYG